MAGVCSRVEEEGPKPGSELLEQAVSSAFAGG